MGKQTYRRIVRAAMKEFKKKYPERKYFDVDRETITYRWHSNKSSVVAFSTGKGLPLQTIRSEANRTLRSNIFVNENVVYHLMATHRVCKVPLNIRYRNDNRDIF